MVRFVPNSVRSITFVKEYGVDMDNSNSTKHKVVYKVVPGTMEVGAEFELPEHNDKYYDSNGNYIFIKKMTEKKLEIRPENSVLTYDDIRGFTLNEFPLSKDKVLEDFTITTQIHHEINNFFDNIKIYEELEIFPKRGLLLSSPPGMGKTASIRSATLERLKDGDTAIVTLNPGRYSMDYFGYYISKEAEYHPTVKKLILIIEDIGGNENHQEDISDLLNFLDGASDIYKVPTFIIATTNYIDTMTSTLSDRPGRFDKVIELKAPDGEQRIKLLKWFAKRELTLPETNFFKGFECDGLTIAYLKEIVIRSMLTQQQEFITIGKEILAYRKRQAIKFEDVKKFGLRHD